MDINDIRGLLKKTSKSLINMENVVATGVGYKVTNGKTQKDLSIVCSVSAKRPLSKLSKQNIIPSEMDGIPVDVFATGPISIFQNPRQKYRPAPGGVSIGHYLITAGTFGCSVKKDNKRYILSNNHVLANSNDADIGDDILQPGPTDGGSRPADVIGKLYDFVPISFGNGGGNGSDCPFAATAAGILNSISAGLGRKTRLKPVVYPEAAENLVDAAIAEPVNQDDIKDEILGIGNISGIEEAGLGMSVKKFGRTTEFTTGSILQIDVTSTVNYGGGKTATFVDQLMAGNMSAGGDSGSAILSEDNKIVGLLFAGSSSSTIINRIQNVFQLLNIGLP